MTFDTYFLVSSFAFVATGALALALTGRLDPVSLLLYALAIGAAWLAERRRPSILVSRKRAVRLSALTIPICIADALLLGNPYLALGRFTLLLSAIKLFQVKEDSDWVWLYALAFCEVLLAASMTIDATFLLSLGLFLFFGVSTLGAFEVRRARRGLSPVEEETAAIREGRPHPLRRSRALSWVTGLQLLLVAVVSIPLFLVLPRFGGGGIGESFASAGALSGFSESVRLGELGPIKLNSTVVMHVELENNHGQYLRWRGIALETFDSRTWRVADRPDGGRGMLTPPSSPRRFVRLAPPDVDLRPSQLLAQKVYLEPVATTTIFAASRVLGIEDAPGGLRIDETGSLSAVRRSGEPLTYTAYSDVEPFDEEVLAADVSTDYPEKVRRYDLQLPVREPLDPRVAELARRTVGDATTPFEKARRIERRLKSFTYSLAPRRVDQRLDPVSDFVLNTQTGHCELFASSMVLMLRELGVPARVVNGFQMGEYNNLTGSYTVRQLDAHSWVEVYFAGPDRWIEFDPTPAVGINTYINDWTAQVRKSMEALHLVWSRYVVSLGTNEQASLLRGAQRWLLSVHESTKRSISRARSWVVKLISPVPGSPTFTPRVMFAGVAMLVLFGLFALTGMLLQGRGWSFGGFVLPVWRLPRLFRRSRAPQSAAVRFYSQMLTMLAANGIERERDATPLEFARSTGIDEVRTITELYNRVRYGGEASRRVEAEVASALARLAGALRRRGARR